jgi:hypothetical protein
MKKRIVLFAVSFCLSCIVVGALFSLWVYWFPLFHLGLPVTIKELQESPQSWVGKPVCVRGQIYSVMGFPERRPPYNCAVYDPASKAFVGVYWREFWTGDLDGKNVTVVGVMRIAQQKGFQAGGYYLDAESITLNDQLTFEIRM